MRNTYLDFHVPSIDELEIQEVVETLRSGWITTGPRVKRFEEEFAKYVGADHSIALNSCTAALHLGLAAIGLKPGDEVIVPSNTFTASAEVITYFGARPIIVDCRRDTFNIDEAAIEERITSKTRAIMPVHMAGQPCEMNHIMDIARHHKISVIEDAAHAFPASYHGRTIGTIGDITAFSFYATKTITTGEGGMVTTANEEYADKIRILSLHGISNDAWKRYAADGSWYYEVVEAGFKYNMTDIAAALGIQQLKKAELFGKRRTEISQIYSNAFRDIDQLQVPQTQSDVESSWHLYILLIRPETLSIDRSRFIEELKRRNIGTSVHFIPLHLHPYYQEKFGYANGDLPNSEWIYERCLSLPIYPGMTDRDVDDVVEAVRDVTVEYAR